MNDEPDNVLESVAHRWNPVREIALGYGRYSMAVLVPKPRGCGISFTQEEDAHPIGASRISEPRQVRPGAVLLTFANRESYDALQRTLHVMAEKQGWLP